MPSGTATGTDDNYCVTHPMFIPLMSLQGADACTEQQVAALQSQMEQLQVRKTCVSKSLSATLAAHSWTVQLSWPPYKQNLRLIKRELQALQIS